MGQADRTHFEQEWRDAFEDAGMTPPTRVWNGIEKSLHGASGNRKRVFLIQLAMAASVLFAMSIGAAGVYQLYFNDSRQGSPVATIDSTRGDDGVKQSAIDSDNGRKDESLPPAASPSDQSGLLNNNNPAETNAGGQQRMVLDGRENAGLPVTSAPDAVPGELVAGSVASSFGIDYLNPFESTLAYTASLNEAVPKGVPYSIAPVRTSKNTRGSWAALGVSTGNYSSGSGANDSYMLGAAFEDANMVRVGRVSEESTGSVFQVEMNFGKRIARKWIIQGGVGYMERNSDGMSNIISARGAAVSNASAEGFSQAVVSAPYRIENSLQLITVPVQVGYIILDRQVGLRVLTGIANEVMLQYRVEDTQGNLSSQTYKPGDSEEYHTYGMSALVSTEVSYTVAERYQVALQPRLRQSVLPLKESDESLPRAMELGFAVRYLFQ